MRFLVCCQPLQCLIVPPADLLFVITAEDFEIPAGDCRMPQCRRDRRIVDVAFHVTEEAVLSAGHGAGLDPGKIYIAGHKGEQDFAECAASMRCSEDHTDRIAGLIIFRLVPQS